MSEGEKLQHQFDALAMGFVKPLLAGETVHVDRAFAPGAIHYFEHASTTDGAADREIFDLLHRAASAIAPVTQVPWPDRDLLLIAMAAHNLVLLTDPKLDRFLVRGSRRKVVDWVDELTEAIEPPDTRSDALARHGLLDPVPALRRRDVVVKNWAYTYRFYGRPVPANVTVLPKIRMVRSVKNLVGVEELWSRIDGSSQLGLTRRMRALMARSPVTELSRLDLCKDFRFGLATLSVLSDDAIRGGIARTIVERGEWQAAPVLGRALGDPSLHQAPPLHLYFALALCFETQMTATLNTPGPALPERLDFSDPDVARYAAVLPAFFQDDSMLDEVRAFDDLDRREVQERCARLVQALPPEALDSVAPLVARCQRTASTLPTSTRPLAEVRQ